MQLPPPDPNDFNNFFNNRNINPEIQGLIDAVEELERRERRSRMRDASTQRDRIIQDGINILSLLRNAETGRRGYYTLSDIELFGEYLERLRSLNPNNDNDPPQVDPEDGYRTP